MIDLHCDTAIQLYQAPDSKLYENNLAVSIKKLQKSNMTAQFFAHFFKQGRNKEKNITPFEYFCEVNNRFVEELEVNKAYIAVARNLKDYQKNLEEHKISAFLTIEGGGVLEGSLDYLITAYEMGIRLVTLTWNYENELGYPNSLDTEIMRQGLALKGKEMVEAMNELGIIVDVSHLSDGGFYDVAEISKKPFIASHSNARGIKAHQRNLKDDMIKIIGECGGVIGINFCPEFVNTEDVSSIEGLIKHTKYIINKGGVDIIALGTDFDGIEGNLEITDISQIHILFDAFKSNGLTETIIEKMTLKNALRIIKDLL